MGTNTAGNVGMPNEGKTDMERGSKDDFSYSKESRQTGRTGGGMGSSPNSEKPDDNKRTVNDPRLA